MPLLYNQYNVAMKTNHLKGLPIILLFLSLPFNNKATAPTEKWINVESKSGIQVYERWVSVNKDLVVKERKGIMQVNENLQEAINTLRDPAKTRLWMEHVSDAYLVKQISDNTWYSYTCFSIPWPFESRDMVSLSTLAYNKNGRAATIEICSKGDALPLKPRTNRLNSFKASWEIVELSKGRLSVSFTAISLAPPEYPRFIQDPIIRGTFYRNLLNLKGILDQ